MHHFKLSLIVTGIVVVLVVIAGGVGIYYIDKNSKSDQEKRVRGERLGMGIGTFAGILVAPFWLFAAAKMGKEKRLAMAEAKSKVSSKKKNLGWKTRLLDPGPTRNVLLV
ncbi:MAG: hypothetical protein EXS11_05550 [Gemmataceae bacterium]|nr:hypothetical protein [Gemmataceae bacterium]